MIESLPRTKITAYLLLSLGFGISAYLLWRYTFLTGIAHSEPPNLCIALFGLDCDGALESPLSSQLGLPLPGWGLVLFATIFAFLLLADFLGESFAFEGYFAAWLLTGSAFLVSLVLTGVFISGAVPFCPLCALIHLINLVLLFSLKALSGRTYAQLYQALSKRVSYLFTGKTINPMLAKWKMLGFILATLVAVVVYQWVLIEAPSGIGLHDHEIHSEQVIADFTAEIEQQIPIGPEDPILGPADALVQLVVFSDFQCPACQGFADELKGLVRQFPEELQLVFKNFPLDPACNPVMETDLHPKACQAAFAAQAAHLQNRFWPFHDALFAADLQEDSTLFQSVAQTAGLDIQRFIADLKNEKVEIKVQADIATANRLKVNMTPTVYLNSRKVTDFRPQVLPLLIDHIIQESKL